MLQPIQDVLIIGGGPGGLATATALARQSYTTTVFDSGIYRNARTKHMHNVPTWDHQDPAAYRAKARADLLARYSTVTFADVAVTNIKRVEDGSFEATDSNNNIWKGRKIVLATGVSDVYPDIPGYDDVWARGVFHCLFCHGYEERGAASAGVLAVDDLTNVDFALHSAYMAQRLAKRVVVYTHGNRDLGDKIQKGFRDGFEFVVETRRIVRLEMGGENTDVVIWFEDGEKVVEGFMVHKPKTRLNGPFAEQLGVEVTEMGEVKVAQPFCETSVAGVFAVGDCATVMKAVGQAVAMGGLAAGGLAKELMLIPPQKESVGPRGLDRRL